MTPFPTSLFKDSQMRKTNKAALANHLISDVQMSHCPQNVKNVLDGGAFLHRVKWPPNATYKELIMQYLRYVKSKYGICCIIFDGYTAGPSIKDHEHERRKTGKSSADIKIEEKLLIALSQELFLSNKKYKTQFVNILRHYLIVDGHRVIQSEGDADTDIVTIALNLTCNGHSVVVADDTYILMLLLYRWKPCKIYICVQK